MMIPQPIIIDTDIGDDVDDAWALTTVLASPELDLVGVTTVSGDTTLRASLALKLLQLARKTEIPVAVGEEQALADWVEVIKRRKHQGQGVLKFDGSDPQNFHPLRASELSLKISHLYSQDLVLVAIGPLTNIACAILQDSSLVHRLKGIVMMGGGYRAWRNRKEHNFKLDPKAVEIVLRSGIPIKMVGYNVTEKCSFSWHRELQPMTAFNAPFVDALRRLTDIYLQSQLQKRELKWQKDGKLSHQRWLENPKTCLHDPLAVSTVIRPDLVEFAETEIYVNSRGVTKPIYIYKKLPDWSVKVEMAQKVSLTKLKKFLKPRWEKFFQSLV